MVGRVESESARTGLGQPECKANRWPTKLHSKWNGAGARAGRKNVRKNPLRKRVVKGRPARRHSSK